MSTIPKDPVILLSYVNTQLRDNYSSLDEMCQALDADKSRIISVPVSYTHLDVYKRQLQGRNCSRTQVQPVQTVIQRTVQ